MRIGINARLLVDPKTRGWNRYTINLLHELPALGVHLVLYSQGEIHRDYLDQLPAGSFTVQIAPPMSYTAWLWRWLPRQIRLDRVDLFHSPFNFGLPPWSACPRVLTLHDAIDHAYPPYRRRRWRQGFYTTLRAEFEHGLSRIRAHRIITVSEASRNDIIRTLGVPARKLVVIPEAQDPHFRVPIAPEVRQAVRQHHALPPRYVIYVGGWEQRKNIPFLLRAFAQADLADGALVLVGGNPEQGEAIRAQAESLGIADRLRLLGWVDDADLAPMLAEATCFAYPSEYEGFGLQLCEAMAVGCPCLAARASSLPEVLGSGGETFALDDPAGLATLLRRVFHEPGFRDNLVARGFARAGTFSWRHTAEQTVAVYRELIG